jgi:hypothetical protein
MSLRILALTSFAILAGGAFEVASAPASAQTDGGPIRLRTDFTGADKCLDIINDGQNNKPTMAACGNFSGQKWTVSATGTPGAVADRVGNRCGAISGNFRVAGQAARSIG